MVLGFNFGGPEMLVVLLLVLVLFGGTQLPKLARGLGQAQKEFKEGLAEGAAGDEDDEEPATKGSKPKGSSKKA